MGKAKRKKQQKGQAAWSRANDFHGMIDLHTLPSVAAINGARIRELTGDDTIPDTSNVILRAFRAKVGERTFHVGFCIGSETGFSAIGIAMIERLMMEAPSAAIHAVPIVHSEIAWDIVLRHLRNFTGQILLFAFPDSYIYDAGTAEVHFSKEIRLFDDKGKQFERLTVSQRRKIHEQAAALQDRTAPKIYATPDVSLEDIPWIFRVVTPAEQKSMGSDSITKSMGSNKINGTKSMGSDSIDSAIPSILVAKPIAPNNNINRA